MFVSRYARVTMCSIDTFGENWMDIHLYEQSKQSIHPVFGITGDTVFYIRHFPR